MKSGSDAATSHGAANVRNVGGAPKFSTDCLFDGVLVL